jgi:hypothetical protein
MKFKKKTVNTAHSVESFLIFLLIITENLVQYYVKSNAEENKCIVNFFFLSRNVIRIML